MDDDIFCVISNNIKKRSTESYFDNTSVSVDLTVRTYKDR